MGMMRGARGELKKGYQVAAHLSRWTVTKDRVEATVGTVNDFLIQQSGPFDLWLQIGTRQWVWRAVEILELGSTIAIRIVGSPESRAA
jgi:hypothetical protein